MIKHSYARNETGQISNINQITKHSPTNKFYCISCDEEMSIKLGTKRAHHFFHKSNLTCNHETYLHKLAKFIFLKTYQNCLLNKKPFYLNYLSNRICNCFVKQKLICDLGFFENKLDLTLLFKEITLEKKQGAFVPDIKLKDEKGNIIFIEMAVTHSCEQNKIDSGYRIIEFKIEEEVDAEKIRDCNISENEKTLFYNFKTNKIYDDFCASQCSLQSWFFVISKKGKPALVQRKRTFLLDTIDNHLLVKEVDEERQDRLDIGTDLSHDIILSDLIIESFRAGLQIKDCSLCRFAGFNSSYLTNDIFPIFCRKKRKSYKSEEAVSCGDYWSIKR